MRALRTAAALTFALALGACAPEGPPEGPRACDSLEVEHAGLVRALRFEVADMGVSEGFDLDESQGPPPEATGCRARDFRDAVGREGVDNQLTAIVPALEMMVGEGTLDGLLQGAINNGQLLIAITLEGVDDLEDDDCVALSVRTLTGTPLLGTDGRLLEGQTLDVAPDTPIARYEGAVLRGGVVETGPFELALPVAILDARFVLDLHGARVRAEVAEDGSMRGVISGGISNEQIVEVASGLNIPSDLMGQVATFVQLIADLAPVDGRCTQFSASMVYEAAPGFVNP